MLYEYICKSCSSITEKTRPMADRNISFPCPCGGSFSLKISPVFIPWGDIASKGAGFPSADDKWVADRERRRTKEKENVKNHGTEYPNLLSV